MECWSIHLSFFYVIFSPLSKLAKILVKILKASEKSRLVSILEVARLYYYISNKHAYFYQKAACGNIHMPGHQVFLLLFAGT